MSGAETDEIPAFEPKDGYPYPVLPEGIYRCDESGLKIRFVDAFADSRARPAIYEGFLRLRQEAMALGLTAVQWVDGSFVEGKLEPGDVDVVSFATHEEIDQLPDSNAVWELLNAKEKTKRVFCSHTFLVPVYEKGHPRRARFENQLVYWRRWFGTTRDHDPATKLPWTAHPKGLIEMGLGDPAKVQSLMAKRGL